MRLTDNWRGLLNIVLCIGTGVFAAICTIIWLQTPPEKAHRLRPLLKEIDGYEAAHGTYPTSCIAFDSFSKITNQVGIYTGEYNQSGIFYWDPWKVEKHDFTVLLNPKGYELFLPITDTERMYAFGFDFSAWYYDSKKGYWRKGRIYYTSWGPYWKPNFLR